jgi:ferric-dicitrate binding protein FerR (iron transport regulator)
MVLYVAEGMVKVSRDKKLLPTVAAGQMLAINKADGQLTQGKADIQTIAAWQQGNMYYKDMRLIDIIRDMQRVYNIDITLSRHELEQKKITTFFPRDIGPRAALDTICTITNSQLDADGSRRFIIL